MSEGRSQPEEAFPLDEAVETTRPGHAYPACRDFRPLDRLHQLHDQCSPGSGRMPRGMAVDGVVSITKSIKGTRGTWSCDGAPSDPTFTAAQPARRKNALRRLQNHRLTGACNANHIVAEATYPTGHGSPVNRSRPPLVAAHRAE